MQLGQADWLLLQEAYWYSTGFCFYIGCACALSPAFEEACNNGRPEILQVVSGYVRSVGGSLLSSLLVQMPSPDVLAPFDWQHITSASNKNKNLVILVETCSLVRPGPFISVARKGAVNSFWRQVTNNVLLSTASSNFVNRPPSKTHHEQLADAWAYFSRVPLNFSSSFFVRQGSRTSVG